MLFSDFFGPRFNQITRPGPVPPIPPDLVLVVLVVIQFLANPKFLSVYFSENQIILISCHCDTDHKLQVLIDNIEDIKRILPGSHLAVISSLELPGRIIREVNYSFITQENPVLAWPQKSIVYWRIHSYENQCIQVVDSTPDYGYAALNHLKRLGEIFLNYPYSSFLWMTYDALLTPEIVEEIVHSTTSLFFPMTRDHKQVKFEVGLQLALMSREDLSRVIERITLENYLSDSNWCAEIFFQKQIIEPLNLRISSQLVGDLVCTENEPTNHSMVPGVCFTILLEHNSLTNVRIFFWNCAVPFILRVNGKSIPLEVNPNLMLDLEWNRESLWELSLEVEGTVYCHLQKIQTHSHSFHTVLS